MNMYLSTKISRMKTAQFYMHVACQHVKDKVPAAAYTSNCRTHIIELQPVTPIHQWPEGNDHLPSPAECHC